MIITWSRYTGKKDPDGGGAITYMTAVSVIKSLDGRARHRETRNPRPRILRGSVDLVSAMIASIPFKCRYSSGVLSFEASDIDLALFHANDPALLTQLRRVMVEFEEMAFAGIASHQRPPVLWTSHSHTGRLELNFLIPRAVYAAAKVKAFRVGIADVASLKGGAEIVMRSFNPHPPGDEARRLMDGFRDRCNSKFGWADPMDPARRRALAVPDHELKLARNATRLGAPASDPSDREKLHEVVCDWIRAGQVNDRSELKEKLSGAGYKIVRDGEDYLSVCSFRDHPTNMPRVKRSMRMKGGVWSRAFRTRDYAMALIDGEPKQERASRHLKRKVSDEDDYQRCLERWRQFNIRRYSSFRLPDEEPMLPVVRITEVRGGNPLVYNVSSPLLIRPTEADHAPVKNAAKATKVRLFRSLYPLDVPEDLADQIRFVNVEKRLVLLTDGSIVHDAGDFISCTKSSVAAVRLMALEASAKQWDFCTITGPDDFLADLAVQCGYLGISVSGINERCQQIINDALMAAELPIGQSGNRRKSTEDAATPEENPQACLPLREQGEAVTSPVDDLVFDIPGDNCAAEPDDDGPSL